MEQAGYPPGANAWPNVSPYMGPAMDRTTYEGGNWFNQQFIGNRKYYFSTEALISNTQRGSRGVRIGAYGVNEVPTFNGILDPDHNQLFVESTAFITNNDMPDRFVTATGGGGGGTGSGDVPIFVERYFSDFSDPTSAPGVRATGGWFNADQSGFQMSGFWLSNADTTFFTGTGLPYNYQDSVDFPLEYDQLHLRAFSGIPLQGADTDGDFRPGVV